MSSESQDRNQRLESFELQIRSTPLTAFGTRLKGREQIRAQQAVIMLERLMVGIQVFSSREVRWCNLGQWWHTISTHDLNQVITCLGEAGSLLVENAETSRFGLLNYDGLLTYLKSEYPYAGSLLGPLKREIAGALLGNPTLFRSVLSYFWFLKKMHFVCDQLKEEALDDYLATERDLGRPSSSQEALVIESWFPYCDTWSIGASIDPRNGNGSTSDAGHDIIKKYKSFTSDSLLHYLCAHTGVSEWCNDHELLRVSKTNFVPKSCKAYRTVSSEPATLMWYQEGLNEAIVAYASKPSHPLARRFDRRDQSRNRLLAQEGSMLLDESYATIDLSHASDSISREHVQTWFRKTALYRWLLCCRCPVTELPDGRLLRLKKWAPMGTAITFSLEVIIFSAIVEVAIKSLGQDPRRSRYLVYGDDIVVENRYYHAVVEELERNGFSVNRSKSFHGEGPLRFRESCGGFYLNGYDVTPLMISRKYPGYGGSRHVETWMDSCVALANECYKYPFANLLRSYLIRHCKSVKVQQQPLFSSDGTRGLVSDYPDNWHLLRKWDANIQELVIIHGGLVSAGLEDYPDEDADFCLAEWLRQAQAREDRWRNSTNKVGRYYYHPIVDDTDVISLPRCTSNNRRNSLTAERGLSWSGWQRTPQFILARVNL